MSYFDEPDSDADDEAINSKSLAQQTFTLEELTNLKNSIEQLKQEGNTAFSQNNYEKSILLYTEAINSLKKYNQPPNSVLHLNRSASYLSEKQYVKALHDANISCEIDENNWKGHWRKGLALMGMTKRIFRTKEAIKSFQRCLVCDTLPQDKRSMIEKELNKAVQVLGKQDEEVSEIIYVTINWSNHSKRMTYLKCSLYCYIYYIRVVRLIYHDVLLRNHIAI